MPFGARFPAVAVEPKTTQSAITGCGATRTVNESTVDTLQKSCSSLHPTFGIEKRVLLLLNAPMHMRTRTCARAHAHAHAHVHTHMRTHTRTFTRTRTSAHAHMHAHAHARRHVCLRLFWEECRRKCHLLRTQNCLTKGHFRGKIGREGSCSKAAGGP